MMYSDNVNKSTERNKFGGEEREKISDNIFCLLVKPPIGGNTLAQKKKSTQVQYNEMRADVSRSNRSAADKSTGHIRAKSVDKTKSYKEKSKPSFVSISQSI